MYSSPKPKQQESLEIDINRPGIDVRQGTSNVRERLLRQHGKLELVHWKPIEDAALGAIELDVDVGLKVKWFTAEKNDEDFVLPTCAKYPCVTQPPALPAPKIAIGELYVGLDGIIPLWHQDKVVNLAVYEQGWPTSGHGQYAAAQLYRAAQAWNDIGAKIKFGFTTDINKATYLMVYGGNNGGVYAMAEFPSAKELSGIYVYSLSFSANAVNNLVNILAHELGHTLGLRHEFATREGRGQIQWGPANPTSVMSYVFPPTIQPSDEASFKALYDYTGDNINGVPIKRYIPG